MVTCHAWRHIKAHLPVDHLLLERLDRSGDSGGQVIPCLWSRSRGKANNGPTNWFRVPGKAPPHHHTSSIIQRLCRWNQRSQIWTDQTKEQMSTGWSLHYLCFLAQTDLLVVTSMQLSSHKSLVLIFQGPSPQWRHEGMRHSSMDLNRWQIGRVVWTRQVKASSEAKKFQLPIEVKKWPHEGQREKVKGLQSCHESKGWLLGRSKKRKYRYFTASLFTASFSVRIYSWESRK